MCTTKLGMTWQCWSEKVQYMYRF